MGLGRSPLVQDSLLSGTLKTGCRQEVPWFAVLGFSGSPEHPGYTLVHTGLRALPDNTLYIPCRPPCYSQVGRVYTGCLTGIPRVKDPRSAS